MKKTIVIPHLLILLSCVLFASGIHVPVNDPVYIFLERMAVRGLIPELLNDSKPLSRDEISNYLLSLSEHKDRLTLTDQKLLEDFLIDYRLELTDLRHPDLEENTNYTCLFSSQHKRKFTNRFYNRDQEETHFYIYEDDQYTVWMDINGILRTEMKNQILRPFGGMGFRLSSQIGSKLSLYIDATGYLWQTPDGFQDLPQEVRSTYLQDEPTLNAQYFDETTAYFQYFSPQLGSFSLNHERLIWGNTPNSMILSGNAAPFGFIQWQKRYKKVKYTFVHGFLQNKDVEIDTLTNVKNMPSKYFVGHRLEMNILKKVNFTFSELIIYGDRPVEIDYLIPASLLYTMEHDQRDRDNNLMAFEIEWFPVNGISLYGNLLLDELRFTEITSPWWANKQGVQFGMMLAPRYPTSLRIEWTAVRPWTYTHKIEENSYTHNGECLGFYAGPNSQLFFVENIWNFSARLYGRWQYKYLRHGNDPLPVSDPDYYPVGGDANQDYSERDRDFDEATKWLMGSIETTKEFSAFLTYRFNRELFIDGGIRVRNVDNATDMYFLTQIRIDL